MVLPQKLDLEQEDTTSDELINVPIVYSGQTTRKSQNKKNENFKKLKERNLLLSHYGINPLKKEPVKTLHSKNNSLSSRFKSSFTIKAGVISPSERLKTEVTV